jgi:hypothetical protein
MRPEAAPESHRNSPERKSQHGSGTVVRHSSDAVASLNGGSSGTRSPSKSSVSVVRGECGGRTVASPAALSVCAAEACRAERSRNGTNAAWAYSLAFHAAQSDESSCHIDGNFNEREESHDDLHEHQREHHHCLRFARPCRESCRRRRAALQHRWATEESNGRLADVAAGGYIEQHGRCGPIRRLATSH